MLAALFLSFEDQVSWFNVFQYVTFRGICGVLTSLGLGVILGPLIIKKLHQLEIRQITRDDIVPLHSGKKGTPTMGGLLILMAVTVSTLLWADLATGFVWVALFATISFGTIGFVDDYLKLKNNRSTGLTALEKFSCQLVAAATVAVLLYTTAGDGYPFNYLVPLFKNIEFAFGIWFIPVTILVIVATSNAVNLTDGLDGLAIMPVVLVAGGLGIFTYVSGHSLFSTYLSIPYIEGADELVIFCGSLVGAGLAFLVYNCYPAQIFMGDTGSMGLGAAVAIVAVVVRQEIVLLIMGGLFVLETISVITQVVSFKLLGRRVWLMSPLHHHFELKGWPEPRITVRFWIITLVLVLVGLATLKIR